MIKKYISSKSNPFQVIATFRNKIYMFFFNFFELKIILSYFFEKPGIFFTIFLSTIFNIGQLVSEILPH